MAGVTNAIAILGEDVAKVYDVYGKLQTASSNPALMAAEANNFKVILNSVNGSDAVKQLAADYIPQFLHFFPDLVDTGINAQMDLIEDEKVIIRIHAIKGLELIAKNNPVTVSRIADVLAQLLVATDSLELNVVKTTFTSLFSMDSKAAFLTLFAKATTGADVDLRKTVLDFLQVQLKERAAALKKDEATSAALCSGLKAMLSSAQNALIGRDELKFFVQTLISLSPYGNNANKIKSDEAFKVELGLIALTQAGLKNATGALDIANEASLKHFLGCQGLVANLSGAYGVDVSAFTNVYFGQLLPNLASIANEELRVQVLHAIAGGATKVGPKQAQAFFPVMWNLFKANIPTGEIIQKAPAAVSADGTTPAASDSSSTPVAAPAAAAAAPVTAAPVSTNPPTSHINFVNAEVLLYLFHLFAPQAPEALKQATSFFEPTGQPGEALTAPQARKDEFINRIQFLLQSNGQYKASLHAVAKAINEQMKASSKKIGQAKAIAAGKAPVAAAPVTAAAAGQPATAEIKVVEPTPVVPVNIEEEAEVLKVLRQKLQTVQSAIRVSANITLLAKPLLAKPMPAYQTAAQMSLSWRQRKVGPEGKVAGGKGQPQQGNKSGNSGNQQGSQQKKQGQKRKSGGGNDSSQQKSQSNKKRGNSSQQPQQNQNQNQSQKKKKQKTGGNANNNNNNNNNNNQGNQQRSNKKQKQSNSNKGGNQQQRQGNNQGNNNNQGNGNRRRR